MDLESIQTSRKTLQSQGWRSMLTILSIVLGITAIITLVSLGEGLNASINKQFQSMGTDTLIVLPGKGFVESAFQSLETDDPQTIESIRGVSFATEIYLTTQRFDYKNQTKTRMVIGVDPDKWTELGTIGLVNLRSGRLITKNDTSSLIAGPRFATQTFEKELFVGSELQVGTDHFRIVGILEEATNSFYGGFMNNAAMTNIDTLKTKIDPDALPSRIFVKLESGANKNEVVEKVKAALKKKHGQTDFQVQTPDQVAQTAGSVVGLVQLVLIGIAAISLLVGGVGVMNTMYMSVSERTSEVGLMKAVGATNNQIREIFLIEASLIGIVGGIIGTILGTGLATLISIIATLGGFDLQAPVTIPIILGAVLFSMVICLVFGYLPALNASQLDPVDAIRKNT